MTDRFAVSAMTSNKQTTRAFLGDLLSRYDWVSTSSHSPEFVTLVSTNVVPTPLQAALLKAPIEFLDAPLNDIQSEIDLLRNLAASLETKIIRLKGIRRDYRAALSPIRRLPSEILVEILRWTPKKQTKLTATEPYHVFGSNVFNIAAGPWHLGQSEKEDTLIPAPKKDMVALLNRVLERSQNHRLEFFFRCWGFDKKNSIDRVDDFKSNTEKCLLQDQFLNYASMYTTYTARHLLLFVDAKNDTSDTVKEQWSDLEDMQKNGHSYQPHTKKRHHGAILKDDFSIFERYADKVTKKATSDSYATTHASSRILTILPGPIQAPLFGVSGHRSCTRHSVGSRQAAPAGQDHRWSIVSRNRVTRRERPHSRKEASRNGMSVRWTAQNPGRIASTPSSSGEQHDDTTSNYASIGVVNLKSARKEYRRTVKYRKRVGIIGDEIVAVHQSAYRMCVRDIQLDEQRLFASYNPFGRTENGEVSVGDIHGPHGDIKRRWMQKSVVRMAGYSGLTQLAHESGGKKLLHELPVTG
ncbi:hypothetical protein ARMGADRAFT_1140865 [Armillaria gallica]|uniref:Uncharacterized protein n=1 Tax=Armillaria gallica TaxID=47427 RepID=A0A2H3CKU2_ARMGA|nr:hypothetical protein ARMGADRAFT_1140865 [Armillaria gallica]